VRHPSSPALGKLNIACIGVGGQGASDVRGVRSENIVALCDVDEARAAHTFNSFPRVKKFRDYRRMLDKMGKHIDAVTISTPDHTHFPAASLAITMGKHVFVQKPLTHTVWEARQLRLAARQHRVATQMGIQGHAKEGARLLCEWVQAGALGPVHEVHIWTDRPIWPQGMERPTDTPPVPSTLDWDLWLGTAPARPYHPSYLPFDWRGWWDFGTGSLGDMGCHLMDASFWALKLGSPISVEAETSPVNNESAPEWSIVTYQFPAREGMPPVKVVWYDGGKKPPRPEELEDDRELAENGQLLIGEKATLMDGSAYCESPRLIPEEKMKDFLPNRPPKTIPRVPESNHYQEWIRACKGEEPAGANFDYAGPLTEMVLLGNLAIRTGRKIEWDPISLTVTNDPEANQYIRQWYRKGWEICV
ncbi:MAG TPA: Gfo/Idh/MocA family oxidoreductase, partial [Firmicutes bacterium]|nr:Gfo/Idh/MocA family oxidoreductase [Bacillota bacterium]